MHHFKVTAAFDGGRAQTRDSLPMGTDRFEFDKTIATPDRAVKERWRFPVV